MKILNFQIVFTGVIIKKQKQKQAKRIIVSFIAACQLEQEVNTTNSAFI